MGDGVRKCLAVILMIMLAAGVCYAQLPPQKDSVQTSIADTGRFDYITSNNLTYITFLDSVILYYILVDTADTMYVLGNLMVERLVLDDISGFSPDSTQYSLMRTSDSAWRYLHPSIKDWLVLTTGGAEKGLAILGNLVLSREAYMEGLRLARSTARGRFPYIIFDPGWPNHTVIQGEDGHNINIGSNIWRDTLTGAWQRFDSLTTFGSIMMQFSGGSDGYGRRDSLGNRILFQHNKGAGRIAVTDTLDIATFFRLSATPGFLGGIITSDYDSNVADSTKLPRKAWDIRGSVAVRDTIFIDVDGSLIDILGIIADSIQNARRDTIFMQDADSLDALFKLYSDYHNDANSSDSALVWNSGRGATEIAGGRGRLSILPSEAFLDTIGLLAEGIVQSRCKVEVYDDVYRTGASFYPHLKMWTDSTNAQYICVDYFVWLPKDFASFDTVALWSSHMTTNASADLIIYDTGLTKDSLDCGTVMDGDDAWINYVMSDAHVDTLNSWSPNEATHDRFVFQFTVSVKDGELVRFGLLEITYHRK